MLILKMLIFLEVHMEILQMKRYVWDQLLNNKQIGYGLLLKLDDGYTWVYHIILLRHMFENFPIKRLYRIT